MTPLKLILRDRRRQSREISVGTSRFTIGSAAENSLVLAGLAERQAVIECFEDIVEVTNLGAGGTMRVNGYEKKGTVRLQAGDVVSLSEEYELILNSENPGIGRKVLPATEKTQEGRSSRLFSAPLIAVGLLVLLVGSVALSSKNCITLEKQTGYATPNSSRSLPSVTQKLPPVISDEERQMGEILAAARQTIKCISDAKREVFSAKPGKNEEDLRGRVLHYQQQPEIVAEKLREVSQPRLLQQAKEILPGYPSLVLYLILAEQVTNPAGSPQKIMDKFRNSLRNRRIEIGEDEHSTLILIAGQKLDDTQWKKIRANLGTMTDATQQRNVWWLHENGVLNDESYRFALDFLALSVIAQAPEHWIKHDVAELGCLSERQR